MPIEIKIADKVLEGFNAQAQDRLRKSVDGYVEDLIEEANRIESGRNSTSNAPEITSSMVNDAHVLIRRGLVQPKRNPLTKGIRILAGVLSLGVGLMYDAQRLQDSGYMLLFVLVVTGAILTITVATIRE